MGHEAEVTVSRASLYREVWTEPVRAVAERYGVSDVALAKTCRRHRIPVPPRGYWAKLRAGQRIGRPKLPRMRAGEHDEITIHRTETSPERISEATSQLVSAEETAEAKIEVSEQLVDPHPLVATAAKSLRGGRKDGRGILIPRARPRLDIRVSEPALERALRIMDALVKALEDRGHRVEVDDDEGKFSTSVIVLEERVFFFIEERVNRVPHEPTAEERAEAKRFTWKRWPAYDDVLSGELRLRIAGYRHRRSTNRWADGKRRQLESCLNGFVAGLVKAAEGIKQDRIAQLQRERERAEETRRQIERDRLRRLEEARVSELERQIDDYDKCQRIRVYVARAREARRVYLPVPRSLFGMAMDEDLKINSLTEWIEWASGYADRIDPFRARAEPDSPDGGLEPRGD